MENFSKSEIEKFVAKGYQSVSGRLCRSALYLLNMETQKAKALDKMHQETTKHLKNGTSALVMANKLLSLKDSQIKQMTEQLNSLEILLEQNKY